MKSGREIDQIVEDFRFGIGRDADDPGARIGKPGGQAHLSASATARGDDGIERLMRLETHFFPGQIERVGSQGR